MGISHRRFERLGFVLTPALDYLQGRVSIPGKHRDDIASQYPLRLNPIGPSPFHELGEGFLS
jgi:hypothetical protein